MGIFDGIPDWNRDGKVDSFDAYMDYMIAHESLGISTDDSDADAGYTDSNTEQ